jgi:hypothetical protein
MDKDKRVSATCPICHEGELRRMDGPPEWYVLPAATLGLPDDEEKRVGRGVPVGISICSRWPLDCFPAPYQLRRRCRRAVPIRRGLGCPSR